MEKEAPFGYAAILANTRKMCDTDFVDKREGNMSHSLQYLLVEASGHSQARQIAKYQMFTTTKPDWSDWHYGKDSSEESFAGRWLNTAFRLDKEDESELAGVNLDTLHYASNPALAQKVIASAIESRNKAITSYQEKIMTIDYEIMNVRHDPYCRPKKSEIDYNSYYKELSVILDNDWSSDSGIYDLHKGTAALYDFESRVISAEQWQYIVAVDFHH